MQKHTDENTENNTVTELLNVTEEAMKEIEKKQSPTVMLRVSRRDRDNVKKLAKESDSTIISLVSLAISNYLQSTNENKTI